MASKTTKTMRLSDDVIEMIEAQAGENFTAKFENLVTRCIWELPRKEQELKGIQERIDYERNSLTVLRQRKAKLESSLLFLERGVANLRDQINRTVQELEQM